MMFGKKYLRVSVQLFRTPTDSYAVLVDSYRKGALTSSISSNNTSSINVAFCLSFDCGG